MTREEIDYYRALMEAARSSGTAQMRSAGRTVAPDTEYKNEALNAGKSKGLPDSYSPSESELKKYLVRWDNLNDYVAHEEALAMIFRDNSTFRQNTDLRCIIIKCSALNDFYATNIFRIAPVARKILEITDFDERLTNGDDTLVEEIALVDGRRNYSFATKYCSHHQPLLYPIFDRYVCDVLADLCRRNPDAFRFKHKNALTSYPTFRGAIDDFRRAYGLDKYSYKEIDRYLWQLGKDFYNPYVK